MGARRTLHAEGIRGNSEHDMARREDVRFRGSRRLPLHAEWSLISRAGIVCSSDPRNTIGSAPRALTPEETHATPLNNTIGITGYHSTARLESPAPSAPCHFSVFQTSS